MKQFLLFILLFNASKSSADISPSAVGWGNIAVPGLGATLRDEPRRGLLEATSEIALFYGGTFGVREGGVAIDGTITIPSSGHIERPLIGQTLQEFGLKLHLYDTFYNYQQAVLEKEKDKSIDLNPQKIYRGSFGDIVTAPFKIRNLKKTWTMISIIGGAAYLLYDFQNTPVAAQPGASVSRDNENFYFVNQTAIVPFGGAMGEEPFFRGFIQREAMGYTQCLFCAIAAQTTIFTLIHPPGTRIGAFSSGLIYGYMVHVYDGDLEPEIAAHFWLNVVDGLTAFWYFQRTQSKNTPFAPPLVKASFKF